MKLSQKTTGNGPPLVLIHGGMGSINHWHRNASTLFQARGIGCNMTQRMRSIACYWNS